MSTSGAVQEELLTVADIDKKLQIHVAKRLAWKAHTLPVSVIYEPFAEGILIDELLDLRFWLTKTADL